MSPHPKCPVCKHPHPMGQPHVWEEDGIYDEEMANDHKSAARSSVVEPGAHNALVAGSIPAAPTNTAHGGTVDASDLKSAEEIRGGSNPSVPTKIPQAFIEAQAIVAENWAEATDGHITVPATNEDVAAISKPSFDDEARRTYQRNYMRDRTQAKKVGMKVKEWRKKFGGKDDKSQH